MTFWRAGFFLLVLLNLVFFAWGQGYFGPRDEGREPERLAKQIAPEKVRLLMDGDIKSQISSTAPVPAPSPEAPSEPASAAAPTPAPVAAAPALVCRRMDSLPPTEVETLQAKAAKVTGVQWVSLPQAPQTLYWVHIPSQTSRAVADKKMVELKSLGISDYHLVETGKDALAISLGQFRSEDAAKTYLAAVQKKGVRSAQIKPRDVPTGKVILEARGTADVIKALTAALGDAATLVDCPAGG